jgi:hypothetical protein
MGKNLRQLRDRYLDAWGHQTGKAAIRPPSLFIYSLLPNVRLSEPRLERLNRLFSGLNLLLLGGFFILTTDNHANLKRPDFCR